MTSIEDIWDAPLEPSSPRPAQPPAIDSDEDNDRSRPSKRPRISQPLFLEDSDDERPQGRTNNAPPIDIDTMFQDAEDEEDGLAFQPLAPDLDLDALRRQASAKHANTVVIPSLTPHAILSSSPPRDGDNISEKVGKGKDNAGKDGERQERKKIARMDETRLLDSNGFPALIKSAKNFVPKGKGHEAADLNRLLQVYQFWTHKMYPKTQFKDTVDRVEKLCHSKRMHVSLSVWRDEAKGLINGMKPGDPDDSAGVIDITSDNEPESPPSRAKRQKSSSPTTDANADMVDVQSGPPSSSTEADGDDNFDIDALMREEEERLAMMKYNSSAAVASSSAQASASPVALAPKTTYINAGADDDEAMWDELNGLGDESFSLPPPPLAHADDEDMWDVVREMDTATDVQQPYVLPPPSPPPKHALPVLQAANENGGGGGSRYTSTVEESTGEDKELVGEEKERRPTNADDWDDMYL